MSNHGAGAGYLPCVFTRARVVPAPAPPEEGGLMPARRRGEDVNLGVFMEVSPRDQVSEAADVQGRPYGLRRVPLLWMEQLSSDARALGHATTMSELWLLVRTQTKTETSSLSKLQLPYKGA